MTEQQDKTNVTPDPKHITAKDYYDYMMDGGDFDFFGAVKKQHEESQQKKQQKESQKKQEPEWESKPIETPTTQVVNPQVKTKYRLQTGVGFNPVDVQEFNCILKGTYYNWLSRIGLVFTFCFGFLMPFLWILFVIMLVADRKQEAQFGVILKSGAKGVINIKGKYNITKFESALTQAKYL